MEYKMLIPPTITAIVLIIGWFINNNLSRKNEIIKLSLKYRLQMLESYIAAASILNKILHNKEPIKKELENDYIIKMEKAQTQFLLYGTKDEIDKINEIVKLSQENKHKELLEKSQKLMIIIRKELRLKLKIQQID